MVTQEQLEQLEVNEVYELMLGQAAQRLGLSMQFNHGGAVVYFEDTKNGIKIPYINSHFNFNTMLASMLATDKAWCYDILHANKIPAVAHAFLSDELILGFMENGLDVPLVLKPIKGLGGKHVYFVHTKEDLLRAIKSLSGAGTVAVSPFETYDEEYRVTVLDGEVIMSYGKSKTAEMQNNLSCGAQVVALPSAMEQAIGNLAKDAVKAMGLRTANVDIFMANDGTYKIMEVNSSVALKRVACASPYYFEACLNAYTKMLETALAEQ